MKQSVKRPNLDDNGGRGAGVSAVFAKDTLRCWLRSWKRFVSIAVITLLGVAVLITYSPQNGAILLVMAFLISPMGLPLAAIWLLGKVQCLKFAIQDWAYG